MGEIKKKEKISLINDEPIIGDINFRIKKSVRTYGCFHTNETVGVIIKQLNVSALECSRFPICCAKIHPIPK